MMGPRATILIVDDEPGLRRVLSRALSRAGYRPLVATSGEEATELLKLHGTVDLILMDLRMPGMTGQTLFHVIASGWPALASRIVVMSGDPESEEHKEWLDLHDLPVVWKPFELPDIIRLVERLMARRREANE